MIFHLTAFLQYIAKRQINLNSEHSQKTPCWAACSGLG